MACTGSRNVGWSVRPSRRSRSVLSDAVRTRQRMRGRGLRSIPSWTKCARCLRSIDVGSKNSWDGRVTRRKARRLGNADEEGVTHTSPWRLHCILTED